MNVPEYYSRDVNYKSFGYDSFNSLKALENGKYYSDNSYWLDTELINNPYFNKLIFNKDKKLIKSSIVCCEGSNGWDDYLLLSHYDHNEKLDEITNH